MYLFYHLSIIHTTTPTDNNNRKAQARIPAMSVPSDPWQMPRIIFDRTEAVEEKERRLHDKWGPCSGPHFVAARRRQVTQMNKRSRHTRSMPSPSPTHGFLRELKKANTGKGNSYNAIPTNSDHKNQQLLEDIGTLDNSKRKVNTDDDNNKVTARAGATQNHKSTPDIEGILSTHSRRNINTLF